MDQDTLTKTFVPSLNDAIFQEVLRLVKLNSKGKIWIIGGFVYRNIAAKLYGQEPYNFDIDFIVEEKNRYLQRIPGWRIEINSYNNQNYVSDNHKMSFTALSKMIRVSSREVTTINDFLETAPLNIQSIAYDMDRQKLLGEKGFEAIRKRIITPNDQEEAEHYAQRKRKKLEDIIATKAKELNFLWTI